MTWTDILAQRPALLEWLQADFERLQPRVLWQHHNDWTAIVAYFAETHDLTITEAVDTLDDWLLRRATPMQLAAA